MLRKVLYFSVFVTSFISLSLFLAKQTSAYCSGTPICYYGGSCGCSGYSSSQACKDAGCWNYFSQARTCSDIGGGCIIADTLGCERWGGSCYWVNPTPAPTPPPPPPPSYTCYQCHPGAAFCESYTSGSPCSTNCSACTATPTPPPCSCGAWANGACSGGGCPAGQRYQTRSCSPAGCANESRCVVDATCTSCTCNAWTNGACGVGGCTAGERYQTRTCSPAGCNTGARCVADATCPIATATPAPTATPPPTPTPTPVCTCGAWTAGACGGGACTGTERYQSRSCSPAGCNTTDRCVADAACVPTPTPTIAPGQCSTPTVSASTPSCVAGSSSTTSITWSWAPVSGATQYEVDIVNSAGTVIINNGFLSASAFSCGTGTCRYSSSHSLGSYRARVRAVGTCTTSNTGTSASRTVSLCAGPTATPVPTPIPTPVPTPTPTPPPGCTLTASPSSASIIVGASRTISITATQSNGTISEVRFISNNPAIASATSPDTTSPYSTVVRSNASGTTTIRVSGIMGGIERCSTNISITAPAPTCTINVTPDPLTVSMISSATITASTTATNGTISEVNFRVTDPSIASVTSPDLSSPYTSRVTPLSDGTTTITAGAVMNGVEVCRDTIRLTVPAPTCTINLSPDPLPAIIGQTSLIAASTTQQNGIISEVQFLVTDPSIASATSPDSSVPYTSTVTGEGEGRTTITAMGMMYGISRCQDSAVVDVVPPLPWYQASGGDAISNGSIISPIPPSCVMPACDPNFITDLGSTHPGIASYQGMADFESGSGTGSVSSRDWLVRTTNGVNFTYDQFVSLTPSTATISNASGTINASSLTSGGTPDSAGYTWYRSAGNLTLNGNAVFSGGRKTILFVDGNLTINGRINMTAGQTNNYFMAIVRGNISVAPSVTNGANPALEGVYFSDGTFRTGALGAGIIDQPLKVRGSVVARSVLLERDLRVGNVDTAAETFSYAPEIMINYPASLTITKLLWREVLP